MNAYRDAERAVLAALLLDPAATIPAVSGELEPAHFAHDDNAATYAAILAVHARGEGVDLITVNHEMAAQRPDETGSIAAGLAGIMEFATTTANIGSHVSILRRYRAKRRLHAATLKLAESFQHHDGSWISAARAFNETRLACEGEAAPRGHFAALMQQVQIARDLVNSDEPAPSSLIGDRLFCAGTLATIVGPPKLGKTALAFQLMRSAGLGIPWLGFGWDGTDVGVRAGMLQYEMTRGEVKARLERLGDMSGPLGLMLEVLCTPEPSPLLSTPSGLDMLEGWITQSRLGLCVIDSHTAANRLPDKAGREEVTPVLQGIAGVARRTGALIVLIHHTKKRTDDAKKRDPDDQDVGESASGSGAFSANTDTFVSIGPAVRDQVKLHFLCRHAAKPDAMTCSRDADGWLERATGPEQERDIRKHTVDVLLKDSPHGISTGKIIEKMHGMGHEITDRTLQRYLKALGAISCGPRYLSVWVHPEHQGRGQSELENDA